MALKILGLDGLMEERGRSLSVGQRQLFCVARAVLSSAKVILFCFVLVFYFLFKTFIHQSIALHEINT